MKLIIDIPEEVVKAIQNGKDYRYDIHTAIAQGTSVSIEGDLISRSALRKTIHCEYSDDLGILDKIDNAPTVEERPQGKWIEHQDYYDDTYYTCSHCGEDWITIEGKPTDNLMNYCPMCGADMREADNGS